MTEEDAARAARAVAVLGELAGAARAEQGPELAVPLEWFRWLPTGWEFCRTDGSASGAGQGSVTRVMGLPAAPLSIDVERDFSRELVKLQTLRGDRVVRVGVLWIAGRLPADASDDGKARRVFVPVLSRSATVTAGRLEIGGHLTPRGDVQLTPLVEDAAARRALEVAWDRLPLLGDYPTLLAPFHETGETAMLDRLHQLRGYVSAVARAIGLGALPFARADRGPQELMRRDGLAVVPAPAVYVARGAGETPTTSGTELVTWTPDRLRTATAFHAVYLGTPTEPARDDRDHPVDAGPFVLAPGQAAAVAASRREPVTVVSGAPGDGKSHTVVAMASDALARGGSVLVATRSNAAVDALMDLFERAPGVDPVVFGSNERRSALATQLAAGRIAPMGAGQVDAERRRFDAALAERARLRVELAGRLRAEQHGGRMEPAPDVVARFPGIFSGSWDPALAAELRLDASATGGWWARHRAERARERLAELAGDPDASLAELEDALDAAHRQAAALRVAAGEGPTLDELWDALLVADDRVHRQAADWLGAESRSEERLDHRCLGAVGALATALRSGRAARRRQLERIDDALTAALPLWLGTLGDIEDLLPPVPALFDLVILDEASCIDQPAAAGALLRARRAVIVGDPAQLRHTSFLSDEAIDAALERHGLLDDPVASRLEVRRNSIFDVAAATVAVVPLDEHFRSAPHLVDFVVDRVYGGRIRVATRTPATEQLPCIRTERVDGRRDEDKVVAAEVDAVCREVRRRRHLGATSVGIVTPFRAQADAIEDALRERFSADDITALDLRVGTVHGFQGNERDVVVVSIGIGPDESTASWRFVDNPHLFTVLVTRARREEVVVLSADPPAGGLLADYLAAAEHVPGRPVPVPTVSPWARELAGEVARGGVEVLAGYPCGRHVIDLVVGGPHDYVAVETDLHPDGVDAHIDRHLALRRAGWRVRHAFEGRWANRKGELVVELLAGHRTTSDT